MLQNNRSSHKSAPAVGFSRPYLSEADIVRLMKSQNADDRAVAAHKVCRTIEKTPLSEQEKSAAQDIIRVLAKDSAELVRRALAVTLRTSHIMPHDVAMQFAQDVVSVALPMITYSPVFSDEDLRAIIVTGGAQRQVAVAKREHLAESVALTLAQKGVEEAVVMACANDNARFGDKGLECVLSRFATSEVIHNVLVHRQALPVSVAEKLIGLVSATLREHLVAKHALRPQTVTKIIEATRERATLDMAEQSGAHLNPQALARHLMQTGRLNASLMLRALARGYIGFFEHALAELSQVPHQRAWLMVHDAGTLGFKTIYERSGLPQRLFQTFRIAITTFQDLRDEKAEPDIPRFQERLIERFLTQMPYAPREDLLYLYERLNRDKYGRKHMDENNQTRLKAA
jgi:uncharacterized protein (DUF2336 family)